MLPKLDTIIMDLIQIKIIPATDMPLVTILCIKLDLLYDGCMLNYSRPALFYIGPYSHSLKPGPLFQNLIVIKNVGANEELTIFYSVSKRIN